MPRLKRFLITVFLLFLVFYAGIHVLSRTEGARTALADAISGRIRQPVAIKECAATPLLGLRLEGVSFQGIQIENVVVTFDAVALFVQDRPLVRRLSLSGVEATFRQVVATGAWEPLVLSGIGRRLGEVVGIVPAPVVGTVQIPGFPPRLISVRTLLDVKAASVVWLAADGKEVASVSGAGMRTADGGFSNGRWVVQVLAESNAIQLASGRRLKAFRLEAFRIHASGLVVVLEMADESGSYPPFSSDAFWSDLGRHLAALAKL